MKTLILVRHAKATKAMFNIEDIDRPLVEKGVEDAYFMAHWLHKNKHVPDVIITSPAVRAYSTGLIMARVLEHHLNKIKINKSLYECGEDGYLDVLSSLKNDHKTVMLVGHNPDISFFAMRLCKQFHDDIPTTGIIGIEIKINDWAEIYDAKGTLKFFEFPK